MFFFAIKKERRIWRLPAESVRIPENDGKSPQFAYDDFIEIENEIAEVLERAFDKCESFADIKKAIENLSVNWDSSKISEIMATAFFMARARGDNDFDDIDDRAGANDL